MKRALTLVAVLLIATTSWTALGDTYALDPLHCSIIFRIKHNNVTWFYGRINAPEGTIIYDPAKPEASSFDITLKSANIDTGNTARDNQLKSPTFFNARDIPTMTFKSSSVKKADDNNLEVTGDLTVHGVTKPLTLKLEQTGMTTTGPKPLVGFEGTFTIKRTDFGMSEMLNGLGDDVRMIVSFEAGKK